MVKVSRLWVPPIVARLVATLPSQASMLDRAVDAPPEVLTLVPVTPTLVKVPEMVSAASAPTWKEKVA